MINPQPPHPDERRKAARARFEPLRVRLTGSREGILMDLSEGGALLVMATAPPRDNRCTITIEWRNTAVMLAARVVRSEQRQIRLEAATLARKDYNVALEFVDMTPDTASMIRRIIAPVAT
jgi:c-di-GMP-binding flagellar brake protein YcgR